MRTHETERLIALQPESAVEQRVCRTVFDAVNAGNVQPHPEKMGSMVCWYEVDLDQYDDLDHELATEAECGVNDNGLVDPDPGSRAMVMLHTDEHGHPLTDGQDERGVGGSAEFVDHSGGGEATSVEDVPEDEGEGESETDEEFPTINVDVEDTDPPYGDLPQPAQMVLQSEPLERQDYEDLQDIAVLTDSVAGNLAEEELVEALREYTRGAIDAVDEEADA